MRHSLAAALLAATAVAAPSLGAQAATPQPIELGLDGGITFGLESPSTTTIELPGQRLRVGFFMRPNLSIEPAAGLTYIKSDDVSTLQLNADVGALYHFAASDAGRRFYVRPFVGLSHVSVGAEDDDAATTQFQLGAGVGLKIPLTDRFRSRWEASLVHGLDSDEVSGGTAIRLTVGLSFFTR